MEQSRQKAIRLWPVFLKAFVEWRGREYKTTPLPSYLPANEPSTKVADLDQEELEMLHKWGVRNQFSRTGAREYDIQTQLWEEIIRNTFKRPELLVEL